MKQPLLIPLLAALCLGSSASARVVYVDRNSKGVVRNGTSWNTAFASVAQALSAAANGDEVWVAKGVYGEALIPPPGVPLYGGFGGQETQRNRRDPNANATVLDARAAGDAAVTVLAPAVTVDGFTLRGATGALVLFGGGATLSNNRITGGVEAGVTVYYGEALLSNNVIDGNTAAGVSVEGGAAVLSNNVIGSNGTAGVDVKQGAVTLSSNTISGCLGDGLALEDSVATVLNNVIAGNGYDGVYMLGALSSATVANNIIAFNAGAGVRRAAGLIPALKHNNVFGNGESDALPGGLLSGGNLAVDPLFLNAATGDFRVRPESRCVDAGDDSVVLAGALDLGGRPRVQGDHVDMGAYEQAIVKPVPFTLADVTRALRAAAGLAVVSADDAKRLDVAPAQSAVTITDAARLLRKVAGRESNP